MKPIENPKPEINPQRIGKIFHGDRDQIEFLKHTLDVLRVGDREMLDDHASTIQMRISRLELEGKMPEILSSYQNKIDARIKGLFGRVAV